MTKIKLYKDGKDCIITITKHKRWTIGMDWLKQWDRIEVQ